jgi:hypothetical protein
MMENIKSNAGQGLGIAGLVLGIISLTIAFIPCIGLLALIPGAIAVTFSAIAYNQAIKGNGARGLIVAALIISIIGTSVAAIWGLVFASIGHKAPWIKNQIENAIEEETGKSIDENMAEFGTNMENVLEQLENKADSGAIKIEINKPMTDDQFNRFIEGYEKLIKETIYLKKKSKNGDSKAIQAYSGVSLKLTQLISKLVTATPEFTKEQQEQLNDVNKKYEDELDSLKK